jgi:hypothetical protein
MPPGRQPVFDRPATAHMAGTARAGDHWRLAQRAMSCEADRFEKCRDCRIGAAHAGERHIHRSAIFDMAICPRCRRGGARMIGGRLCVSCYNREREFKIGRMPRAPGPASFSQVAGLA